MSTGKHKRNKGVVGEREVKSVFAAHRWTMRGLEGQGDHIAIRVRHLGNQVETITLHVECKRQEQLRLPLWLRQAAEEAPPSTTPVVCFRQNRGRWYAALPLDELLELVG
jgi:hypothetical protein